VRLAKGIGRFTTDHSAGVGYGNVSSNTCTDQANINTHSQVCEFQEVNGDLGEAYSASISFLTNWARCMPF
jgi:hypothetical protein